MIPEREIAYSTRPYDLGDLILLQGAGQSNWMQMAGFFKSRTDMNQDEIIALDEFEIPEILEKIAKAHETAIILKVMEGSLNGS